MPRPNATRKIIVADSEEELEAATAAAQKPGEPEPDTPEPLQPEPEEEDDDEKTENGDDAEEADEEDVPADTPADPPGTAAVLPLPTQPAAARLTYENRIFIVDAWQYPGSLRDAPPWVDRNWAGYAADYDPLRQLEPGPCLRVPLLGGVVAIVRIGDYVVTQEVKFSDGLSDLRLEVWEQQQFEKFFMASQ
jgi:hypothetical protein